MPVNVDASADDLTLSSLSIHSEEDWDKSSSSIIFEAKPSSRPMTPKGVKRDGENPGKMTHGKRRLAELLQKHAEDGTAVELSAEDEAKLGEELADWINADSSPIEPDEDWFERKAAELKPQEEANKA